jgi:hypothetical protein
MTTTQITRHHLDPRFGARSIVITLAVVVALAVGIVLIVLPHSGRTHSAAAGSATRTYAPLIHFRGTGAPPVAHRSQPTTSTHTTFRNIRDDNLHALRP